MKKTIIGFSLLLSALLLAWFLKDLFITFFIIPVILGALKLGRLIDSMPQIVWWILLCLTAAVLLLSSLKLPDIRSRLRKKIYSDRGRLGSMESLIKETMNSSTYSGQQLSLLIINMYRKSRGEKDINIHNLEQYINSDSVPDEIKQFAITQYEGRRKDYNQKEIQSTLEKAVAHLKMTITGDPPND